MDWGMQNRLSRIIRPDTGRTVMLAVDHGYFLGPTSGLETPKKMLAPLVKYADSLMLTRGVLRNDVDAGADVPIVLRVSGGSSVLKELSNEEILVSMEEAIRLNVTGVAMSIFVGGEFEEQTLKGLSDLINCAEPYGIPVLAVTAVGKEMGRDARYLALASRIAGELGARVVKTYYCEGFEKVAGTCPVPCVIAGGKKITEPEALQLTYDAIQAGAVGVDMGRNIFQSTCPVGMIQAVRHIVHENGTPASGFDLFKTIESETNANAKKKPAKARRK